MTRPHSGWRRTYGRFCKTTMNPFRLGRGHFKRFSVLWLGSPSLTNRLLRLFAIMPPFYQS
jgi:hypothetical protein